MQYFKGDALELKMYESGKGAMDAVSLSLDEFYDDAYDSQPFGDLIAANDFAPLSKAIALAIFRASFNEVFNAFVKFGTFESYISVFKKIFGDDVDIVFEVPGPGQLNIDIQTANLEIANFVARRIVGNAWVYDQVVDQDGDKILFRSVKGFTSQYELQQMLFELVPAGVYTEITLTVS